MSCAKGEGEGSREEKRRGDDMEGRRGVMMVMKSEVNKCRKSFNLTQYYGPWM